MRVPRCAAVVPLRNAATGKHTRIGAHGRHSLSPAPYFSGVKKLLWFAEGRFTNVSGREFLKSLHAAKQSCGAFEDSERPEPPLPATFTTEDMMESTTTTQGVRTAPQPATPAAAHAIAAPGRYDGYRNVHKALRLFMTDTLTRVGRTDPGDGDEVDAALAQVGELMDLCELHVKDENEFIHPALERAQPGSAARIAAEHASHQEAIADLRDLGAFAANTRGEARAAAMFRLYHALALFVAENFAHMHVEETAHNAVLWAHYSDAELMAIERELVASIPPQAMVKALHWFLPAMNAPERFEMLRGMQAGMPPEAFLGVLEIARRTLSPSDHTKLARALEVSQWLV